MVEQADQMLSFHRKDMGMAIKYLSSIANDVIQTTAAQIGSSVEELVEEFEGCPNWKENEYQECNERDYNYSRKLIEYCCSKAVKEIICGEKIEEKISDGSFSRFTFDAMLAWQMPTFAQQQENEGKGREDRKRGPLKEEEDDEDIPLFYSDMMPLLVNDEASVGEEAYVWLGSFVPLVADVVNARFTFETLTAPTDYRLFFPAYDKLLREIHKTIKHLEKQGAPKGESLREDEVVLHVEGTATSQRVVRHIGGTSWPGRLTLTNYGLYFEASGVISYENAVKMDLSVDVGQTVKPAATGPWGAPLFDKAIVYDSPLLEEGIVLEFPEMASSTRRDHWLALTKEILLLHAFLSEFKLESPWEMHARTILAVFRLHAAREMLRISPPDPSKFLIFALYDEIPKGDYVLEKLAKSAIPTCSASLFLRRMMVKSTTKEPLGDDVVEKECRRENVVVGDETSSTNLQTAIFKAIEEDKEVAVAKATTEQLKEEGISESILVFVGLLKPLKSGFDWFQGIVTWERPATTLIVVATMLIVTYREWVGKGMAAVLCWVVGMMMCARLTRMGDDCKEIVLNTASSSDDNKKSTMESVVSAQHSLRALYELVKLANISILKARSVFISKARKQAEMVMIVLIGVAVFVALIPTKYIVMGLIVYGFTTTSSVGQSLGNGRQGNRRLREWWDSIPLIPVRLVDEDEKTQTTVTH